MKRILSLISTALLLVIVFAVPVSAVIYTKSFTSYFMEDFSREVVVDGATIATFVFDKGPPDSVIARMYMGEGCTTGRTFVQINCDGIDIRTASSSEIEYNRITCVATLVRGSYTSKTNHYAIRECNGVITGWDYYHTSPTHTLDSILDPSNASEVE